MSENYTCKCTCTGQNVEVVIYTPDSSTEVTEYFLNGEKVDDLQVTHLDPGKGFTLSNWRRHIEWEADTSSPAAADLIRKLGRDAEKTSSFITEGN